MSRLMSFGAERHAIFGWHIQLSRPLCMSRPYESTSVIVHAKITEQSFSVLCHSSRLYESTHVYESTPATKKFCNG